MRLLYFDELGILCLAEFFGSDLPLYAILSHTWGADSDEVTYKDVIEGTGTTKFGYDKIKFCGEQARRDGLRYFWVDTCTIDKSSSAELTEAINSMFRWYQRSAKCYALLSDVSTENFHDQDLQFRKSRWFTRGWTLQEMVAAPSVEFFNAQHIRLGDKMSLRDVVHEITGVPFEVFQGRALSQYSVDERLSWVSHRSTKREEDKAYSLLGIFNVHMPLIYGEGEESAFKRLHEEIHKGSRDHRLDQPQTSPWIVPFERNARFTGREPQLAQLEQKMFSEDGTTRIAVVGLGGMGKTQLVLELLHRVRNKHDRCSIIWIPATNMESLHQAYLNVARQLEVPGWQNEKADVKKLVQQYLGQDEAGPWLLVYDNADDIDMWLAHPDSIGPSERRPSLGQLRLIDYLPRSKRGSIIFTTRDKKAAVKLAQQNILELKELSEEPAIQLLRNTLSAPKLADNNKTAVALLSNLTYLPLAIVQAAAYINENSIDLTDYLSLLEEQEEDVIDLLSEDFEDAGRYRSAKNPIANTWLISFDQLRRRDPLAADYLSFMSCVDQKDIPLSLLPPAPSRKKETDAIGSLCAYSFVTKRPSGQALDLHRLVHLATRNWLRKEGLLAETSKKVVYQLAEVFPSHEFKKRPIWRMYLPHASVALTSNLIPEDDTMIDLLENYANCLIEDGRWEDADPPNDRVVKARTARYGVEHPATLRNVLKRAVLFWNTNRWIEAEGLFEEALELGKRVEGPEHPNTMNTMTYLAVIYSRSCRLDEAEKLVKQALESQRRVLGPDHSDVLSSMSALAVIYWRQGRLDESEEVGIEALQGSRDILGVENPDILDAMQILAATWESKGKRTEAIGLMEECIELADRTVGVDHPRVLVFSKALAQWKAEQANVGVEAADSSWRGPRTATTW